MYTYKTLIRDKLVDNAGIKAIFGATATGSCRINLENLRASASYPQVLIGWGGGETTPNMDADEGRIYLTVEAQGSGTIHPYHELSKFRASILGIVDDTAIGYSGAAGTTAVCYHFRKFSDIEGYDTDRRVHWLRIGFNADFKQTLAKPI